MIQSSQAVVARTAENESAPGVLSKYLSIMLNKFFYKHW